jgi:hypothetical protein
VNSSSTFADKEVILRLLRKVERRTRAIRLGRELTFGLVVALSIPVAFKTWDLFYPLATTTIETALIVSAIGFLAYALARVFHRGTLFQAAASVDEKANLYDAMTSASWFIHQKQSSKWIDAQLEDTARHAATLDVWRLYPAAVPRAIYVSVAMIFLFVVLNLIPLSLNHNWFKLKAAPEGIPPQKVNLMQPSLDEALKAITKEFQQSGKTQPVADALAEKQLSDAADELRKLAREIKDGRSESSQDMRQLQQALDRASQHSAPGLEQLSQDLAKASEGIKGEDRERAQQGLQSAANDLEKLQEGIREQQANNNGNPGEGQKEQRSENTQQRNRGAGVQSNGATDKPNESKGDGTGMNPSARPPRDGERTTLEVQLEQERLAGMPDGGGILEDIHESSKQQISKVEYSNVQSELAIGRKDLMSRGVIPWEYRSLVKGYMQAIRPKD